MTLYGLDWLILGGLWLLALPGVLWREFRPWALGWVLLSTAALVVSRMSCVVGSLLWQGAAGVFLFLYTMFLFGAGIGTPSTDARLLSRVRRGRVISAAISAFSFTLIATTLREDVPLRRHLVSANVVNLLAGLAGVSLVAAVALSLGLHLRVVSRRNALEDTRDRLEG
jgi:hypothetical protein